MKEHIYKNLGVEPGLLRMAKYCDFDSFLIHDWLKAQGERKGLPDDFQSECYSKMDAQDSNTLLKSVALFFFVYFSLFGTLSTVFLYAFHGFVGFSVQAVWVLTILCAVVVLFVSFVFASIECVTISRWMCLRMILSDEEIQESVEHFYSFKTEEEVQGYIRNGGDDD